jgi:hypothetical protein
MNLGRRLVFGPARRDLALNVALLLVAFVSIFATMSRDVSIYDEGLVLTGAMRVASRDVPHRDFRANYGPAQFYALAGLFKIFGTSVMTERLWDVLIKAGIATCCFAAVRAYANLAAASVIYAVGLVWLAAFGTSGFPLFPAVLTSLAATLLVLPSLTQQQPRPVQPMAGGGCVGLTALFRYDVGGMVFAVLMAALIVSTISRRDKMWPNGAPLIFSLGVTAVFGPAVLGYLIAGGPVGAFLNDVVHSSTYYAQMRSLPFPSLHALWNDPTSLAIYFPPAVVLAAIVTLATSRESIGPISWVIGTFAAVCVALYIKGWVRISVIHAAGAIIFALITLPIIWKSAWQQLVTRGMIVACAVLLGVPTLFALKTAVANATPSSPCSQPAHLVRMACFKVGGNWSEAVKFAREHVAKDERLFVGLTRHDKIFINDNLIYFVAGRAPATRWHHFDPGLQTRADIQSNMIAELERLAPRYIFLESAWDGVVEPNASALSSGITLLDDYIRRHYRPVRQFGTLSALERRQ